jgi:hypothetical protein
MATITKYTLAPTSQNVGMWEYAVSIHPERVQAREYSFGFDDLVLMVAQSQPLEKNADWPQGKV